MNTFMYENVAVQANLQRLRERGWHIVEPTSGALACGHVGPGRLAEIDDIIDAVRTAVTPTAWAGRKVVIAAGPTREHLDPVRFLSNPSSGRTGFALAAAARRLGAQVSLVHGPVTLPAPADVTLRPVTSAQQMYDAVMSEAESADVVFMTAAVADWTPVDPHEQK